LAKVKVDDDNKKHYFSTLDDEEKQSIISVAINEKIDLLLWEEGLGENSSETFFIKDFELASNKMSVRKEQSIIQKLIKSKLLNKTVYLKFVVGKMQYFSYAVLKMEADSPAYYLHIKNDLYKGQQRSNYRLKAGRNINIMFKVSGQVFNALDISAGGTCFLIDTDHQEVFKEGKEFKRCELAFNKKKFVIPLTVVASNTELFNADGKSLDKNQIGVQFQKLPKALEEDLFRDVNSEARAEEMRKAFLNKRKK
jgi:c-di-GMP-binding flagellar brake protein YcgR